MDVHFLDRAGCCYLWVYLAFSEKIAPASISRHYLQFVVFHKRIYFVTGCMFHKHKRTLRFLPWILDPETWILELETINRIKLYLNLKPHYHETNCLPIGNSLVIILC